MAAERLSMRTIREVLRLKWEKNLNNQQIATSCNISRSTVRDYVERAQRVGLSWPLSPEMDDAELEHLVFPSCCEVHREIRNLPFMAEVHKELSRKGVTLRLLWLEYKAVNPGGYQYSQYCVHYRLWAKNLDVSLRQTYRAGEKLFVDYAGQTIPVADTITGQARQAQLFVATLGASNYTFAWASFSQDLPAWINAHVRAFDFFGGVPEIIVPDNLKAGVAKPCRYEPDINPTYHDMAGHYGTVIIPARVGKPKDKAKVESAVLIAERWIIAALRNHTFFSLSELNKAIAEKLVEFNDRELQKLKISRKELFKTTDKPALKPLPCLPYEYAAWKKARVNIDYHIELEGHYYSVPYQLVKEQVDVRITSATVEVLFKHRRVASHQQSCLKGRHTTLEEHMPKAHQKYLEWTPSRIIKWAGQNGPNTEALVSCIMEGKRHPEQGFRSCLGIMRLGKRYSPERLEAACARAIVIKAYSYKSVESILKSGLDRENSLLDPFTGPLPKPPIQHANIRGKIYYH
jgi:transposase